MGYALFYAIAWILKILALVMPYILYRFVDRSGKATIVYLSIALFFYLFYKFYGPIAIFYNDIIAKRYQHYKTMEEGVASANYEMVKIGALYEASNIGQVYMNIKTREFIVKLTQYNKVNASGHLKKSINTANLSKFKSFYYVDGEDFYYDWVKSDQDTAIPFKTIINKDRSMDEKAWLNTYNTLCKKSSNLDTDNRNYHDQYYFLIQDDWHILYVPKNDTNRLAELDRYWKEVDPDFVEIMDFSRDTSNTNVHRNKEFDWSWGDSTIRMVNFEKDVIKWHKGDFINLPMLWDWEGTAYIELKHKGESLYFKRRAFQTSKLYCSVYLYKVPEPHAANTNLAFIQIGAAFYVIRPITKQLP